MFTSSGPWHRFPWVSPPRAPGRFEMVDTHRDAPEENTGAQRGTQGPLPLQQRVWEGYVSPLVSKIRSSSVSRTIKL